MRAGGIEIMNQESKFPEFVNPQPILENHPQIKIQFTIKSNLKYKN